MATILIKHANSTALRVEICANRMARILTMAESQINVWPL
jgi:hypothetical protein